MARSRQQRGEPKRILRRITSQVAQKKLRDRAEQVGGSAADQACLRFEIWLRSQLMAGKKVLKTPLLHELSSQIYTSLPKEAMDAVHDYVIALAKAANKEIEQGAAYQDEGAGDPRREILTGSGRGHGLNDTRGKLMREHPVKELIRRGYLTQRGYLTITRNEIDESKESVSEGVYTQEMSGNIDKALMSIEHYLEGVRTADKWGDIPELVSIFGNVAKAAEMVLTSLTSKKDEIRRTWEGGKKG